MEICVTPHPADSDTSALAACGLRYQFVMQLLTQRFSLLRLPCAALYADATSALRGARWIKGFVLEALPLLSPEECE